ncbi:efflux RND transporter periplasmic adaptor subunit [Candidatus Eisenbacteria bacterium]|uniref:Efflux RND transporter periplasmic adaptor subunit n=1 Tax=Eiseniibacteriota bacterium TaxID=2212470 RepID=A0ABV6YIW7_UNCEI
MSMLHIFVVVIAIALAAWIFPIPDMATAGGSEDHQELTSETSDEHAGHDHATGDDDHGNEQAADDAHAGHDHEDPDAIVMSRAEATQFGIELQTSQVGSVGQSLTLTGELRINGDRMAHIVPRMPGVVYQVRKKLGDSVTKGEVMAVLESRDLADAKAEYLAALERHELAQAVFEREERLRQQEISSEQEFLDARQVLAEANILLRSARQKLFAMGLTEEQLHSLPTAPDNKLTHLEIRAPFTGTIVEKHITIGEQLSDDETVFVVADLSTVWLDLNVHERHLGTLCCTQEVAISVPPADTLAYGTIEYIHPVVDETTRTVLARVQLPNPNQDLRPGTFVSATVTSNAQEGAVVLDRRAIQYLDDAPVIFTYDGAQFKPRRVLLGRDDNLHVEILAGLDAGVTVATEGSFRLKAEIDKRRTGDIGHGHAH